MRLKHVKGAEETVSESPLVIAEPQRLRGRWHEEFGDAAGMRPIRIEIGMGKGQFLTRLAQVNPKACFIGIEKYSSVLLRAVEKQEELQLPNLRLVRMDAEALPEVFAPGEAERIYLNFSDPWPKDRHTKRRLTSDRFLARYEAVLAPGGTVEFKTDNTDLFAYSLATAEACGWEILSQTEDLHADPVLAAGNVMTEYEEKFSAKGNPICRMVIRWP